MSDFSWLARVQSGDWNTSFGDTQYLGMTLREFSARSGGMHPQGLIHEFRDWAFAHKSRRYAIVWTNANDPDDVLLIFAYA